MKIIAYHGGNLDKGIHDGRLFFTDDLDTAHLYGQEGSPNYKIYKCELTFENPLTLSDDEYDEYMQNINGWDEPLKQGYDAIICEADPKYNDPYYYVALNPIKQVKILKVIKSINEEQYIYAHIENTDYDEFEVFTDEVEVMIFSPNDNIQRLRQFLKDKGSLRCIIDKDIYLWDAHEATHGAMHDYLKEKYGCKYTYGNAFMFDSKHIDPTSLNDVLFHIEDGKEFLDNYKMLKELLGIDYDKYALKDLEKLKQNLSSNTLSENKKTYYHGSEYPIHELKAKPMFFTDSEKFARSLEWNGLENEKCNRYVYSCELEYSNPYYIKTNDDEIDYENRMMDTPIFEKNEDALIYKGNDRTPEYIVVKNAKTQVKNFKLVNHVYENIYERLNEELQKFL